MTLSLHLEREQRRSNIREKSETKFVFVYLNDKAISKVSMVMLEQ